MFSWKILRWKLQFLQKIIFQLLFIKLKQDLSLWFGSTIIIIIIIKICFWKWIQTLLGVAAFSLSSCASVGSCQLWINAIYKWGLPATQGLSWKLPFLLLFPYISNSLLSVVWMGDVGKEFSVNQPVTGRNTWGVCAFHHGRNFGGKKSTTSLPSGREDQGRGDVLQV